MDNKYKSETVVYLKGKDKHHVSGWKVKGLYITKYYLNVGGWYDCSFNLEMKITGELHSMLLQFD